MSLIPQLTDAGRSMITGAMDGGSIKFERMVIGAGETTEEPSKGDFWYDTSNEQLNSYKDVWATSEDTFSADADAPETAEEDDLWYDTTNSQLKIYTLTWHDEEDIDITIASTAPASPADGDYWYDTTNSLLKVYDEGNDEWITDTDHNFVCSAAAPSEPEEGDWWYDTVHSKLKEYNFAWDRCHTVFTYGSAAPTSGNLEGDLWYDTENSELKEYAAGWNPEAEVNFTFGTTPPNNPENNDLWYDSQNEKLKEYSGSVWTEISTPITISPSAPTSIASLTSLIDPKISISLSSIVRGQNYVSISGTFTNADLASGFKWSETGIIASDENGDEFLYAYCNSGDQYDYLPAGDSGRTITGDLTLLIAIGDAEDVSARIGDGAVYVTRAAFEEHLRAGNPHGISKDDIGLGNVENLKPEDLQPVFSDSESSTDFSNGEKLGSIIGKIKYAVTLLKNHLTALNPHSGAANKDHTHSAGDITSGTLSIGRGGTGASSAANARKNLGVNGIYALREYTSHLITFNPNGYVTGNIEIESIAGYTPVAIAYWAILNSSETGSTDKNIAINNIIVRASYVAFHMVNYMSTGNSCKLYFTVLYIKDL